MGGTREGVFRGLEWLGKVYTWAVYPEGTEDTSEGFPCVCKIGKEPVMSNKQLETSIEQSIIKYINNLPKCKAVKWSQDGRQRGNPDIIASIRGHMLLIEVKQPGSTPSKLQEMTMRTWQATGAHVIWVDHLECVKRYIDDMLGVVV